MQFILDRFYFSSKSSLPTYRNRIRRCHWSVNRITGQWSFFNLSNCFQLPCLHTRTWVGQKSHQFTFDTKRAPQYHICHQSPRNIETHQMGLLIGYRLFVFVTQAQKTNYLFDFFFEILDKIFQNLTRYLKLSS